MPTFETAVQPVDRAPQRPDRWFYLGMAVAALVITFVGFHRSFYFRPSTLPALAPLVVVHGLIFSSWVVLFLTQTTLVAARRVHVHRKVGLAALGLAVLIIGSGPLIAITAAKHGRGSLPGLLVMLVDILAFAVCIAAALYYRHRSAVHKRFMVLAMASLLPPAIIRWPIATDRPAVIVGMLLVFVAAAPVYDLLSRRRLHPVSLWGGLVFMASVPLRLALSHTETWHRVASWLIR
jgi:hypothetical protein